MDHLALFAIYLEEFGILIFKDDEYQLILHQRQDMQHSFLVYLISQPLLRISFDFGHQPIAWARSDAFELMLLRTEPLAQAIPVHTLVWRGQQLKYCHLMVLTQAKYFPQQLAKQSMS